MENTEIMNNQTELEVIDNVDVVESEAAEYKEGKGLLGVAIGAVVAGVGIILYKRSKKADERRMRALMKKGYVIYTPEEVEDGAIEEDEVVYVNNDETTEK